MEFLVDVAEMCADGFDAEEDLVVVAIKKLLPPLSDQCVEFLRGKSCLPQNGLHRLLMEILVVEWNRHKQVSLFELHVAPSRAQLNESCPLQRGDDFLRLDNR